MKTKSPKPPLPKHPLTVAFEEWKKANADMFEARSLGRDTPNTYLRNRLKVAFMSGAAAFEAILKKLWADALK